MSAHVYLACGCTSSQPVGGGGPVEVRPCSRHRELGVVRLALDTVAKAQEELRLALRKAHEELPPLQIEQEERGACGERYR